MSSVRGHPHNPQSGRLPAAWQVHVSAIRDDHTSGAASLTARAVEALVDLAASLQDSWEGVTMAGMISSVNTAVRELAAAQPAMAPLRRLCWAVEAAAENAAEEADASALATAVRQAAAAFNAAMQEHQRQAAEHAAALLPTHACVLTHSASSAVEAALLRAYSSGRLARVSCLEARPLCEGRSLATRLAEAGIPTALAVDALAARLVSQADVVLVGGDSVAPGGLINKAGTATLALAARACQVPVYAVCQSEKFLPSLPRTRQTGARPEGFAVADRAQLAGEVLPDPVPGLTVANYYFDLTPLDYLTAVISEAGPLSANMVRGLATGLRAPSSG